MGSDTSEGSSIHPFEFAKYLLNEMHSSAYRTQFLKESLKKHLTTYGISKRSVDESIKADVKMAKRKVVKDGKHGK